MTPQELKNSILQLAIQGKLVEQRAEEGTGRELLEKILAAEGAKGKGEKSHAKSAKSAKVGSRVSREEIPDDEKPLDIPESWEWVRLGEIVEIYTGKRDANFGSSEGEYDFFTCSNQPIKCSSYSYDGEFLIMPGNGANIGMVIHYKGKFEAYQRTYLLENRFGVFMDYLECHLKANWKQYNADKMYGFAIPYIKLGNLTNYLVAIPPLAEQKRIVAKIEELLPLIDRYEKAWSRLEDFNKRFPVDMQKSLLQLAIQGKFVEQRADEGTGAELLEKILSAEGAKSAKKGYRATFAKSAKESRLASNVSRPVEDVPFDIPESWEWVRLGEIMLDVSTGPFGSMLHKADYCDGGIPLVNPMNIQNGRIVPSDKMRVSTKTAERLSAYRLSKGMIVVARRGELGRCASVGDVQDGWLCGTGSFFLDPSKDIFVPFITLIISSPYARQLFAGKAVGTTMANLNHNLLKALPIPLPPLAEQKRIVAKLEELLSLCDRLK